MGKESAGLVVYRKREGRLEFLLVHPGGPFWENKDAGAWTIPKGEFGEGEEPLRAAKREFQEEIGIPLEGAFVELIPVKQKGGKLVRAWSTEKDCDLSGFSSNTFEIEWPPKSGQMSVFPEVDKAEYFGMNEARVKVNPAQIALLEQAAQLCS
jgi:predicted NUDIX family NTP pyrophosphohydrolase